MEGNKKNQLTFSSLSSITSPMEEGTPTAPLNISNSPSTNILGKKYFLVENIEIEHNFGVVMY